MKPFLQACFFLIPRRAQSTTAATKTSLEYCVDAVRQHDYENFLATLLLNKSMRSPSFVVRAFNVEVARVQDQTTDKHIGQMRLQFWQDAVEKIFEKGQTLRNVPAHPISQELFNIINSGHKIHKRHLERLIKSRNLYLKKDYFSTLTEVEQYAEETVSPIYYLILNFANVQNVNADHAVSHLGKAQGIVNLLRSVHISSHQRVVTLPLDILTKHGVSQESVLRAVDSQEMRDVVFEVASRAHSHLDKARSIQVPKEASAILLPAAAVEIYLTRLQQRRFNIFDKSLLQRSPKLPLKLYYNKFLKKF